MLEVMKSIMKDPAKGQDKNNAKTADMWWKRTLQNMKITHDDVKNDEAIIEWINRAEIIQGMATYNVTSPVMDMLNMRIPGIWTVGLCDDMCSIITPSFNFESTRYDLFMDTDALVWFGRSIHMSYNTTHISYTTRAINAIIDKVIATIDSLHGMTIDDATLSEINRSIAYDAAQIGVPKKAITRSISFSRYLQMVAQSPITSKVFTKEIHSLVDTNPNALLIACTI